MGVNSRHVVMVGVEIPSQHNPYDEGGDGKEGEAWEQYETRMKEFDFREAKPGSFVYFCGDYSDGYTVCGILLELSADSRHDEAWLKFKAREISEENKQKAIEKTKEAFDIEDVEPKLYCFTHHY